MVKPILQLYPVIPAADEAERAALRPIGRSAERYQQVIQGITQLVQAADELGFWGVATIEHHFHSEGYEVGPQPGILNAHWAGLTHNVRIGQLGYTMGAQNPLRVAEETAILDHLTRGRFFVGFSRGYQARWTNILGQHLGSRATLSPSARGEEARRAMTPEELGALVADDETNRRIFEENVDLVLKAWQQDSIEHHSPTWQIPYPYEAGVEWLMSEATARLGAPGEVDADGSVRRISVVPAPYTRPHPPVFVASQASRETIEYCGRKGFIPTYFSSISRAARVGGRYVESAAGSGRRFALGEHQALVRWMQIGRDIDDARRAVAQYDLEIYRNLYRSLTPVLPLDESDPVQSMLDSGLWAAGSVAEVRDEFVRQWRELPAEYVVLIFHYAQMPADDVVRNMELFMRHVKPALDEMTEYEAPAAV
jgi:alkanesulfonate monooxygenase SsuD/methylene tetrahydromethanopterin reductase-like flavin-dependent oxidoreductase (luciferase family)